MVTKNQLRLQMLNVVYNGILSEETILNLTKKLSEEELGALVVMLTDISQELNIQEKHNDSDWLVDVAKKYHQLLLSLNVSFLVRSVYVEILDNGLNYLNFRKESGDISDKNVFDAVYGYVHILRCKCEMPALSISLQEYQMFNQILKCFEPELNLLVMSMLSFFSFADENFSLAEEFWKTKKAIVSNFMKL